MSHSKYEYVRGYEEDRRLVPNNWIVVRVDGKAFHHFSDAHGFQKPNDKRALDLMNCCAKRILANFSEAILAYGQSDEYSFVFKKDTQLYSRRAFKLVTNVVSMFASSYVMHWSSYFPDTTLRYPPSFDGRAVPYPTNRDLRNYLCWRQADCHINNLYNTAFWTLVLRGGLTNQEAEKRLRGTLSADKNELLFADFGLNYNNEPEQFRKGTVVFKRRVELPTAAGGGEGPQPGEEIEPFRCGVDHSSKAAADGGAKAGPLARPRPDTKVRSRLFEETCDIIGDAFWQQNDHLLAPFAES